MNTKQKIGRACMIVGILLILGALALLGYNQWDANRADKASQDALGKLEETLTETIEDKTKDEEPVVQPELLCLQDRKNCSAKASRPFPANAVNAANKFNVGCVY